MADSSNSIPMPGRRSFLRSMVTAAGATLAGTAAIATAAVASDATDNPDADLFAWQDEIAAATQEVQAALDTKGKLEAAYFASKPSQPVGPEVVLSPKAKELAEALRLEFAAEDANPPPEKIAHRAAMQRWEEEDARLRETLGLDEADAAVRLAGQREDEIRDAIAATPATTLAGLIFKARYAVEHYPGDPEPDVVDSILDDLLAMSEEEIDNV